MAYTPYNQALPDTSRYNIDPVLLERLYQPARQDPYQAGMLREQNDAYYADPFGYTNNKFGVGASLDELLKKEESAKGLFSPATTPVPTNDGGGDFGGGGGTPNGSFGLGMGVDGVDAGLGGPGSGVGMSPQQGGILGGIIGGLFGMPMMGYQAGKYASTSPPTTNTPPAVVNAAIQNAAVTAAVHARGLAESGASPAAQAAANTMANDAAVAAAQNSGSAPSGLGGDLGTGASDAAGFGGFGGVW